MNSLANNLHRNMKRISLQNILFIRLFNILFALHILRDGSIEMEIQNGMSNHSLVCDEKKNNKDKDPY